MYFKESLFSAGELQHTAAAAVGEQESVKSNNQLVGSCPPTDLVALNKFPNLDISGRWSEGGASKQGNKKNLQLRRS